VAASGLVLFSFDLAFLSRLEPFGWERVAMAWERRLRRRVCAEHGEAVSLQGENESGGRDNESTLSTVPSNITMSVMPATSSTGGAEGKGITLWTSGRDGQDGRSASVSEELTHVAEMERVGGALNGREEREKRGL